MKVKRCDFGDGRTGYRFWCTGCGEFHAIPVEGGAGCWTFSGDEQSPTFSPSILVGGVEWPTDAEVAALQRGEKIEKRKTVCHSFVRSGRIEYLSDCTHSFAGKTVDMRNLFTEEPKP